MKFNLDTAWRDAMGLLQGNLGLLATIAGVFYFIPYAAASSLIPELGQLANPAAGTDPDAMIAMVEAMIAEYWWLFLGLIIVGAIGSLAMLALVRQRSKPTVGEALGTGVRSVPTYLVAQIIQSAMIMLSVILLVAIPSLTGVRAIASLGAVAAMMAAVYILVKLSLVSPIIAIEGQINPVAATRRSWQLTKGSSLRLAFFYILLIVAFFVISSVLSLVATLALAFASAETAQFGMAVVEAATNAVAVIMVVCILAAVHTQLARLSGGAPAAEAD